METTQNRRFNWQPIVVSLILFGASVGGRLLEEWLATHTGDASFNEAARQAAGVLHRINGHPLSRED